MRSSLNDLLIFYTSLTYMETASLETSGEAATVHDSPLKHRHDNS